MKATARFLVIAVLVGVSPATFALTCRTPGPADLFEATDHAVVGRYLEHRFPDAHSNRFEVTFLVEKTLKGEESKLIKLTGVKDDFLDPGRYRSEVRYLIFVEPGLYRVGPCGYVFELKGRYRDWYESLG